MEKVNQLLEYIRIRKQLFIILAITVIIHLTLLIFVSFKMGPRQKRKDNTIFKIVDIREYIPPPKIKKKKVEINKQEDIVEDVIETELEVKELEIDYLPQHLISEKPVLPVNEFKSRKVYPPLANKQGIEGVVYLELYIDHQGFIKDIKILKDPGYGLGEAAVKAVVGLKCIPAKANGIPVAVKFRFPVRFSLRK